MGDRTALDGAIILHGIQRAAFWTRAAAKIQITGWGFAQGPAGDSLPAIITPSHTVMRCFHHLRWVAAVVPLMTATPSHARPPSHQACAASDCLRWVAADDGHTITRTATITHQACAASDCILGGASHTATITTPHTDGGALRRGT